MELMELLWGGGCRQPFFGRAMKCLRAVPFDNIIMYLYFGIYNYIMYSLYGVSGEIPDLSYGGSVFFCSAKE